MLFVLSGVLGIASYDALLNTADLTVAPGAAAFIMSTSPIFTAILATVFLREKLNPWGWLGSLFSLAGSGLIACGQPGGLAPDQGTCASPGVQSGACAGALASDFSSSDCSRMMGGAGTLL